MKQQQLTLYTELWLMKRLREHGCTMLDAGVTTAEERRQRVAEAIQGCGLESIIIGRGKDGKALTYAEAFERLYKQALPQREADAA